MTETTVQDPIFIFLTTEQTQGGNSNRKGHLFEKLMAHVMHSLGYAAPTTQHLNVKSDGIELDISTHHEMNRSTAIAECKAYTTNVAADKVTGFYGKLMVQRYADQNVDGFFFAIPRLTSEADAFVKKAQACDLKFQVFTAQTIFELLRKRTLIDPIEGTDFSDPAVVVHESGVYSASIQLDDQRTAARVCVSAVGGVPPEVLEQLAATTYARGLEVARLGESERTVEPALADKPLILEVKGSSSDFEYQLPASPKYFVGRSSAVKQVKGHISSGGGPLVLNAQSGWGKSSMALKLASQVEGTGVVLDTRTASSAAYVPAAMRHAAEKAVESGHLTLAAGVTWATTQGALASLSRSEWSNGKRLTVIFDQFENVFTNVELTTAFRDLALLASEHHKFVTVGFAWKTDYVDWTENHPFKLRDQIREVSQVVILGPLSRNEVDTILKRLEAAADVNLTSELKQRLREYSQGLPWLLKKLSGHLLREIENGKTQEQAHRGSAKRSRALRFRSGRPQCPRTRGDRFRSKICSGKGCGGDRSLRCCEDSVASKSTPRYPSWRQVRHILGHIPRLPKYRTGANRGLIHPAAHAELRREIDFGVASAGRSSLHRHHRRNLGNLRQGGRKLRKGTSAVGAGWQHKRRSQVDRRGRERRRPRSGSSRSCLSRSSSAPSMDRIRFIGGAWKWLGVDSTLCRPTISNLHRGRRHSQHLGDIRTQLPGLVRICGPYCAVGLRPQDRT